MGVCIVFFILIWYLFVFKILVGKNYVCIIYKWFIVWSCYFIYGRDGFCVCIFYYIDCGGEFFEGVLWMFFRLGVLGVNESVVKGCMFSIGKWR